MKAAQNGEVDGSVLFCLALELVTPNFVPILFQFVSSFQLSWFPRAVFFCVVTLGLRM